MISNESARPETESPTRWSMTEIIMMQCSVRQPADAAS